MNAVLESHLEIDERGVVRVEGSRTKVLQLVLAKQAYGWSPEELKRQFSHLSLAQIHAALTYYYDHQDEIDAQIATERRESDELSRTTGPQPFKRNA